MKCNFKIRNYLDIEIDGRIIDLHNNFDFTGYQHNEPLNQLTISFVKSSGSWVPAGEFAALSFTLKGINYLRLLPPDPELPGDEDQCLMSVTFYYPDDREEDYWLLAKELPDAGDDIIFRFRSDRVIRANCDSVILEAI